MGKSKKRYTEDQLVAATITAALVVMVAAVFAFVGGAAMHAASTADHCDVDFSGDDIVDHRDAETVGYVVCQAMQQQAQTVATLIVVPLAAVLVVLFACHWLVGTYGKKKEG